MRLEYEQALRDIDMNQSRIDELESGVKDMGWE